METNYIGRQSKVKKKIPIERRYYIDKLTYIFWRGKGCDLEHFAAFVPCRDENVTFGVMCGCRRHVFRVRLRGPRAAAKIADLPGCRQFVLKATCYLPVGYPTEIVGVCLRADSIGKRKASK